LALMEKRRVGNNDQTETMTVIGDVRGKQALIIDDEVDTAGTLMETVKALCDYGVTSVRAAATHGVLSGPAMKRIAASPLEELVLTDTLPLAPEKRIDKINILTLAPLLGEAIKNIHTGQSVSGLFN
jgi:ribose-phosphate pyrophosphokinase